MTFTRRDAERIAEILGETARAEILPRFRNLAEGSVRTKCGPLDMVTEADMEAERVITGRLQDAFPGVVVIGEEAASCDMSILERLGGASLAIVVDPVDGTANFAAGVPMFASMAGVVVDGEVVAGVIHDPLANDSAIAVRGEGAWIAFPDGRTTTLQVCKPAPFGEMIGKAAPRHFPPAIRVGLAERLLGAMASWDYRCAAHEYRMVASGHCHFLLFNQMMPWDHLPGWLLHREAGGYAAKLDGSEYRPTDRDGGLLCAPDAESWRTLHAMLFGTAA